MSETKQVLGPCQGILEDGSGWVEFQINTGGQYPVRLKTKKEEIIAQARAAGIQQAVWTFNESDGNPNPHRPGTFYKNRYLEQVVVGGQLAPQAAPQAAPAVVQPTQAAPAVQAPATQQAPQVEPGRPEAERRSIERQTLLKAMVPIYPVDTPQGDAWWWNMLGKLDDFYVNGLPRPQQAQQPPQASGGGSYERDDVVIPGPTPPPDDDIPF